MSYLGPSAVTMPQLGMEAGAGVLWHPAFVSETLGVCVPGPWASLAGHSGTSTLSITSWLK